MSLDGLIGVDVGGTKIAAGLLVGAPDPAKGREQAAHFTIPTRPERGGAALLGQVRALVERLTELAHAQDIRVAGIGIGVPELVAPDQCITSAATFDWRNMDVRAEFADLAPCVIEADVRAAARAEALHGAGQTFRQFAFISLGTGISYSLVTDGVPFTGARGNALILASGALSTVCPTCGHAHRFVLEDYASGPALAARYNQQAGCPVSGAPQVFEAQARGDSLAESVLASAGDALGVSVGFMVNLLDPEALIIGGGLGARDGLYWDRFVASCRAHIWADTTRTLPILHAALGSSAGWIGAALSAQPTLSMMSSVHAS